MRMTTVRTRVLALCLAGASLAGAAACGGSTTADVAPSPEAATLQSTAPPDTTATVGGTDDFCELFQGLSNQRQQRGEGQGQTGQGPSQDGFTRHQDEAAWDRGIETVGRIASSAPPEISTQADTYLQLVRDRKELAASYGYGEVPKEATLEFGRAHASMQQQANELIAYAKDNCDGVV
jgi:hypothetical protein